jgi:AcrR family transcriptional regulator
MSDSPERSEGLRERKRRETRKRLAETGLRLFLERGYEETTLDAIAEAAGVSRRTFFHYFDHKEGILLTWQSGLGEAMQAAILGQRPDQPPVDVVLDAALQVAAQHQDADLIRIERLMKSAETLRARKAAKFSEHERAIFDALRALWPAPERREGLRLVAMVAAGALRVAFERWAERDGAEPLVDHMRRAFAELKAEIATGR